MMDRLTRWAIAGSLAWLAVAVGLILGTHGHAAATEASSHAVEVPAASWSAMPAASGIRTVAPEQLQC